MNEAEGVDGEFDRPRLLSWLTATVDPSISSVEVTRLGGGHSGGAWRLDLSGGDDRRALILKAPTEPSVVHRGDACREGRILGGLHRAGAPVPAVVAVDDEQRAIGRRCFVMAHVEGHSPADSSVGGFHDDLWLRDAGAEAQRAVWESFYDSLAALHSADVAAAPEADHGGVAGALAYWRSSLLDVAAEPTVPQQLALIDWLGANGPPDANEAPAVCMGDARMANCLVDGTEVRALIDFEVAYAGHPAADVGYSTFMEAQQRQNAPDPLPGIGTADEAWARWAQATGRDVTHRAYWTAFGAMVLVITATRAMIQWGLAGDAIETDNPLVPVWEDLVTAAAAS